MKVNKNQFLLFFLFVIIIVYSVVKTENKPRPIANLKGNTQSASQVEVNHSPNTEIVEDEPSLPEPYLTHKDDGVAPTTKTSESKIDPLNLKIMEFSLQIKQDHETRLRNLLSKRNKENLMGDYLSLKQERAKKLSENFKSRSQISQINQQYHEKLFQVFGREIYQEYLESLKTTNAAFKRTKIVLEF